MDVFAKGTGDPKDMSAFIHHFRAGDLKAFKLVFYQYYSSLRYFVNKLIGDEAAGEQIVEDSFTDLWNQRERFPDLTAIKTFLYISAHHRSFRFLRKHRKKDAPEEDWEKIWTLSECMVLRELVRVETLRTVDMMPDLLPILTQPTTTTCDAVSGQSQTNGNHPKAQPKQSGENIPPNKSPI